MQNFDGLDCLVRQSTALDGSFEVNAGALYLTLVSYLRFSWTMGEE